MNLYQIIGLTKTYYSGKSYQTDNKNKILHNENGKGIIQLRSFTRYIIYALLENICYAIHLSEYDSASFCGKLCHNGIMEIFLSNYEESQINITHIPTKPLFIYANFELREYYFNEFLDIYLYNDKETRLFRFDGIGDDERVPNGGIFVNMELFTLL